MSPSKSCYVKNRFEVILAEVRIKPFRGCLKITYFTQFRCCQKNLILKILDVFLRLNSSSALNLNKLSNFQTAS
jgi:hypothetical protein